jgi:hypothetical protein
VLQRPGPRPSGPVAGAAAVLAVKERGADEAESDRWRDVAGAAQLRACEQAVQHRPGGAVLRAVLRVGNLDHDAVVDGVVFPRRQFDVPVAVGLALADATDQAQEAVDRILVARLPGRAPVDGLAREVRHAPPADDRPD